MSVESKWRQNKPFYGVYFGQQGRESISNRKKAEGWGRNNRRQGGAPLAEAGTAPGINKAAESDRIDKMSKR